uniref:Uncharacterized protein n=1 Tax=Mycena chlorophos TaxID=658473 RepID=A0ABQ0KYZ7_MYCCL|nr:predicted protein [Mycena chlorophos]
MALFRDAASLPSRDVFAELGPVFGICLPGRLERPSGIGIASAFRGYIRLVVYHVRNAHVWMPSGSQQSIHLRLRRLTPSWTAILPYAKPPGADCQWDVSILVNTPHIQVLPTHEKKKALE